MNKALYDREVEFPNNLRELMRINSNKVKNANPRTEGYKRNQDLQTQKWITYKQLKRIKNWFDNYDGDGKDAPFILNGADYMKNWVNSTLNHLRNKTQSSSQEYKPEYNIDPSNDFENIQNLNRPTLSHKKTIEKYDTAVTESLKRINQIMKKLI